MDARTSAEFKMKISIFLFMFAVCTSKLFFKKHHTTSPLFSPPLGSSIVPKQNMITCTNSALPAWRAALSRTLAPRQNRSLSNRASAAQEARANVLSHFERNSSFREVRNLLCCSDYEVQYVLPSRIQCFFLFYESSYYLSSNRS